MSAARDEPAAPSPGAAITLGLTVNPEFVQCEGVGAVLENVVGRLNARVVTTVPAVMEPSDDKSGGREPPLDAGIGKDRLLDRALWGKHALFVKSAPSFAPRRALYAGLAFQPPEPDRLTDTEGPKVAAFLAELKRQGVETQLQIMAAAPPCYRVQSRGSLPDAEPLTAAGTPVANRVDSNLSLAHPELRRYVAALVRDLVEQYPDMDVVRFDWPEYPPYHPDSLGFDFAPHAMQRGRELGVDTERLKARVLACLPSAAETLRAGRTEGLSVAALDALPDPLSPLNELIRYRQALVVDYAQFLSETLRNASGGRVRCCLNAFPPPLNILSGLSFKDVDPLVSAIGVKLYTMHWPMIERAYVERMAAFAGGDPEHHLRTVRAVLGLSTEAAGGFATVGYPRPHETHPAGDDLIEAKLRAAAAEITQARLWGMTHAYGPTDDVVRRFQAVRRAAGGFVHINRYGYLSDDKIAALEQAILSEGLS